MSATDDITLTMRGRDDSGGFVANLVPEVIQGLSVGAVGTRAELEAEIDEMMRALRTCWEMEPDAVMRLVAGLSARCTELMVHLHRIESKREYRQIRTQQVDRVLQECERQFRVASRLLEGRRQDLELLR